MGKIHAVSRTSLRSGVIRPAWPLSEALLRGWCRLLGAASVWAWVVVYVFARLRHFELSCPYVSLFSCYSVYYIWVQGLYC